MLSDNKLFNSKIYSSFKFLTMHPSTKLNKRWSDGLYFSSKHRKYSGCHHKVWIFLQAKEEYTYFMP